MRFILGVLLGYYMRGKKRLLIITLTVHRLYHHVLCGSSRNRSFHARAFCDARTSFTTSANLGSRGHRRELRTGQIKLRDANLKIHVLGKRYDPQFESGLIIAQTPQGGERVDCGTVIGVTLSAEDPWR